MRFLAHRANLAGPDRLMENSPSALVAALSAGFGIETDVRDAAGDLVISHDIARSAAPSLASLLTQHRAGGGQTVLALNIKADGLRARLSELLQTHATTAYFCFDMSVPETLAYHRENLRFFTRESEYEPNPVLYADAAGVWLDMFLSDWVTPTHILGHLDVGKEVALVSPELHQRPHLAFWETLRAAGLGRAEGLMLCTDFPISAEKFFHD